MNKCPYCGAENIVGSSFCIKCGSSLNSNPPQPNQNQTLNETVVQSAVTSSPVNTPNVIQNERTNIPQNTAKISIKEYFILILAILLKPFTTIKEESNKLNSFKNSFIIACIASVLGTILNLLKTMLNTVRVTSYNYSKGVTTTWVWENLKEISYVKVIGQNFLILIGIMFAIAIIYYMGSLIIKKQVNFGKLLGITSVALIPMIISTLLLAPLGSLIYSYVGVILNIVGIMYSIIILFVMMNEEINLTGDIKIYFNTICIAILIFGTYFLLIKYIASITTSGLDNALNLIK